MKILVATARTQGRRANDYHHCIEGELVQIDDVCARGREDPDGSCGCGRGFAGLNSHLATTTARVADLPLTMADYTEAIRSSMTEGGYCEQCVAAAADEAFELSAIAYEWPVDTVVRRRLDELEFDLPRAWSS